MIGLLVNIPNKDRETFRLSLYQNLCGMFGMELLVYMEGGEWADMRTYRPKFLGMKIEDAQGIFRMHEWVFLLPKRGGGQIVKTVMLAEFQHPHDNVIYVIGPNYASMDMDLYAADHVVTIETDPVTGNLHSYNAAAILAHDRWRRVNGRS